MFGLGMPELIIIAVIALVVLGPRRLPELGRAAGRAISAFTKASQELTGSLEQELRRADAVACSRQPSLREQALVPKGIPGGAPPEAQEAGSPGP